MSLLQAIADECGLIMLEPAPSLQAIVDVTKDQMNITKYANNPEIMAVFNKMSTLFAPKP
jgi:hypothetical protein